MTLCLIWYRKLDFDLKYTNSAQCQNNTFAIWPLVLLNFNFSYSILKYQHCQTVTCRLLVVRSLSLFSLQFFIKLKVRRMPRQRYAKVLGPFLVEYGWQWNLFVYSYITGNLSLSITMSWVGPVRTSCWLSLVLYFSFFLKVGASNDPVLRSC